MLEQAMKEAKNSPLLLVLFLLYTGGDRASEYFEGGDDDSTAVQIATMQGELNLVNQRLDHIQRVNPDLAGADIVEFKDASVKNRSWSPQLVMGIMVVNGVLEENGYPLVVTSGDEPETKHGDTSLHYTGEAADIRSQHIETPAEKAFILQEVRSRLNEDYDFIIEGEGKEWEHYHLEYQPKRYLVSND